MRTEWLLPCAKEAVSHVDHTALGTWPTTVPLSHRHTVCRLWQFFWLAIQTQYFSYLGAPNSVVNMMP